MLSNYRDQMVPIFNSLDKISKTVDKPYNQFSLATSDDHSSAVIYHGSKMNSKTLSKTQK